MVNWLYGEWTWKLCFCGLITYQLFLSSLTFSQTDSSKTYTDTSKTYQTDRVSSPAAKKITDEFKPTKSPMLALGLSAALPGAGQIYTKNYWKVPIIWGVGGYWVYEWIHLNNSYKEFRRKYSEAPHEQNLRLRDFYRDERDKFAWFLGALYIINLVDAYAGAHLYDFDISPELSYDGRIIPKVLVSVKIEL
ncbi:MAG: DUF5683 domain-containing protein [Bacteroidota bacterium]|nr:DUF5683 domain-containing protein [Bacteroidota bacterium]